MSNEVTTVEAFLNLWETSLRDDIFAFCDFMNFEPHSEQQMMLQMISDLVFEAPVPKRGLCKAGTGTGKTWGLAIGGLWLLLRNKNTRILVAAVNVDQVSEVYLRSVKTILDLAPSVMQNIFDPYKGSIRVKGYPEWLIDTLSSKDVVGAAGRHDEFLYIFVEEVSNVPQEILNVIFQTLTQPHNLFFGIGNPNFRSGQLYKAFNGDSHLWPYKGTMNKLRVSADRPDIVHPNTIEMVRQEHGEDSDEWRVKVLGEFPQSGDTSVINLGDLAKAQNPANHDPALAINPEIARISIDFARYGPDSNVIAVRLGNCFVHIEKLGGRINPIETVRRAMDIEQGLGLNSDEVLYIGDSIGVGGPAMDLLRMDYDREIFEFKANSVNIPNRRYANMAAMGWFNTAELLSTQTVFLGDPEHEINGGLVTEMCDQLAQRDYKVLENEDGQRAVESKDTYKKRAGGVSPDLADAIIMACYDGVQDLGTGEVWTPDRSSDEVRDIARSMEPSTLIMHRPYQQRSMVYNSPRLGSSLL